MHLLEREGGPDHVTAPGGRPHTADFTDPTQVVMSVERARLAMQLASQIRGKAVEAYTDIFHTQV